ncbi:hypothetical protein PFISCL1PPCAC_2141 [Pristionchus fissidentatus]|uniref:Uncharacterized protein n=1 Tax=Pristionchus fissidentatus TaxID=1538716 RepID=A0AAV5UWX9_9BILA|nr:hypothetical protein PFISCL1PPCAC_2141 [Pristionchus fissidentatus]
MIITTKSMAELAGTLTGLPLLVWVAEQFQFGFSFCSRSSLGFPRAIPIIVTLTTLAAAAAALGQIHFSTHSYAGLLISSFTNSFMGAPVMSLGNRYFASRARDLDARWVLQGFGIFPSFQHNAQCAPDWCRARNTTCRALHKARAQAALKTGESDSRHFPMPHSTDGVPSRAKNFGALDGLFSSLATLPAEQIVGRVSDAVRGDSESPQDRLFSLKLVGCLGKDNEMTGKCRLSLEIGSPFSLLHSFTLLLL